MSSAGVLSSFLAFFLIISAIASKYALSDEIVKVPTITFGQFDARAARDALTNLGVLQIVGIPKYDSARKVSLENLANCMKGSKTAHKSTMEDGSIRLSMGASSVFKDIRSTQELFSESGFGSPEMCVINSVGLREAVDLGVQQLLSSLDQLVSNEIRRPLSESENSSNRLVEYVMDPHYSFSDILKEGNHLEHFHTYHQGSGDKKEASTTNFDRSADDATIDFHTDGGLFIAMTTGRYNTDEDNPKKVQLPSSPIAETTVNKLIGSNPENTITDDEVKQRQRRGLYIQLPNGRIAKAVLSDDALVIMVGEAGARWLAPVLGSPLRSVPHALYAGLAQTGDAGATRAWYVYAT
jgi:hypothetical protein